MTQRWRWKDDQTPKHVAMTTWETSPLPEIHASSLAEYDAVIVPSGFCADVMCQARKAISNIIEPGRVHVVPHCFDEIWWPQPAARAPHDPFRFVSLGAWGERKNMLGLIRAYLHAFTKADRVELLLLIPNPDLDEIRSLIARSGIPPEQLPELHVPGGVELEERGLVELYQDADAFVTATRGEGWGLGMFEAMIVGTRVIAPLWGGQSDFLEGSALHYNVPGMLTPCFGGVQRGRVVETEHGLMQAAVVSLPPGVDCKQVWFEPDLSVLAAQMRSVYTTRNTRRLSDEELTRERDVLEAKFGYHTVGAKLSNTLKEIAWGSTPRPSTD